MFLRSAKRCKKYRDDRGATLVEYALAAAFLVAVLILAALGLQTAAVTAQKRAVAPHEFGGAPRYVVDGESNGLAEGEDF